MDDFNIEKSLSMDQQEIYNDRIKELAGLDTLEQEETRKKISDEFGIRVSTVDKDSKKTGKHNDQTQGKPIELYSPKPWEEPVNGQILFDEVANVLRRHMHIRESDIYAVTLWIAHAHCYKSFLYSPRLVITAPTLACGKTVLLSHLVGGLTPKSQSTDHLSPAVFFRLSQACKPTFLIDEVDSWLKKDNDLPGAINGGFGQQGCVLRCVGDGNEVHGFSTFTPTAMAGIGLLKKLPGPILSRSIIVELDRALPGEIEIYYDKRKHFKTLDELNRKLTRWTQDNAKALAKTYPTLPNGVLNRQADKWEPLFAIAETVGGDWPGRAKQALLSEETTDSATKGDQLLTDIKILIEIYGHDYEVGFYTEELISELCNTSLFEDSPWSTYNFRGRDETEKKLKPRQLAKILRDYKLKPKLFRRGEDTGRGYRLKDLNNILSRYLPPLVSVTPLQPNTGAGLSDFLSVTDELDVTHRNPSKPKPSNDCNAVTDTVGVTGEIYEPGIDEGLENEESTLDREAVSL